ncbi:RICIN domain-containing protein [Micromonospora sp. WMMD1082]|uniref:RICIN domain-containing protein n=1 Tax=Micromonospora sp. WMMD1082 TaxID=3016104 RepID=UPI002415DD65|nr:RICIN domain-containing protein [Micromonospora sp. WMMD1082]MDG4797083.1 RICIN domain-containing protein [Micromonospora sp. WMMD1082]
MRQGVRKISKIRRSVARLAALLLVVASTGLVLASPASAATTYLYTTFKGDGAADQELWVYRSTDATSFSVLADTNYRGPSGVLRDPSIINHNGRYYIAHTAQSWTTNSTYFNIASSTDLVSWTHVASVNSGIADTRFVWAPEFFVEGNTVRVIASVAQTTCANCFRPYVYTAQNSALTSWSGPVQMGGLGTNYIDTFVVRSGATYHAFVKNETSKYIEHWTSTSSLTSGWTSRGALWSSGYEGPALVRMENGTWRIYVDRYTNGGIWTATSSDLDNWSGLSSVNCSGCRHGTVLAVSSGVAEQYRVTARHSGRVLDVIGASTANGAEIKQWGWNGGGNQRWTFEDAGGGYFRIVNQNSGKCLDVASASTADRANIVQYTCSGATHQQWQWRAVGSYFQLVARHSGKCLDVVSAGTGDGVDIQQFACGNQDNQQWSRTPV